jgi:hypothetical protein
MDIIQPTFGYMESNSWCHNFTHKAIGGIKN